MNKDQKKFIYKQLAQARAKKLHEFQQANPSEASFEEKVAVLKKAGFIEPEYGFRTYDVNYLSLAQTAQHKKNKAAYDKLQQKLNNLFAQAELEIELNNDPNVFNLLNDLLNKINNA